MKRRKLQIYLGEPRFVEVGRFVIAEVIGSNKIRGIGISRKSDEDKWNKETGYKIALGRAQKALLLKETKKRINNMFMG